MMPLCDGGDDMTTPDPFLLAAQHVLDRALDEMRQSLAGAANDALNWRPGGDDTNSLAVLAVHALSSTRSWLSVATGAPLPERDRDAEFEATASDAASLLAWFDGLALECRALLEPAGAIDWRAVRRTHPRPDDRPEEVSGAWALLHALEHLREHEGQLFLTRQLWDQRASRAT
jgi:uncharacterized damage-inducible protein DinB